MTGHGESEDRLAERLRNAEPAAISEVVHEYTSRLLTLAQRKVGRRYRRRFDPEDAVQSALGFFFEMSRSRELVLERQGDLWRLLATLTISRVRNRIRINRAAKRTVSDEDSFRGPPPDPFDRHPGPEDLAVLADEIRTVRQGLAAEHRYVFDSLLGGQTFTETAEKSGCSVRTVQRIAADVKLRLEERLELRVDPAHDAAE